MNYRGFSSYLRYKSILELLANEECSTTEIIKKTRISQSTVYGMLNELINHNLIFISRHIIDQNGTNLRVFKLQTQKAVIKTE